MEAIDLMYLKILEEAEKHFKPEEILLIKKAYLVASDLHRGQKRKSGEPYFIHPLHVAYILLVEMRLHDANSIAAAFLHDTIEDTGITAEYLAEWFNPDVAQLVVGVTKIKGTNFPSQTAEEQANTRILLQSVMKDFRVIFIKLADRLHNMRTLEFQKNPAKRAENSLETIELFTPIAERVGAYQIKCELEDIAFSHLYPAEFKEITGNSQDYIFRHQSEIEDILGNMSLILNNNNLPHEMRVRFKNAYSFYRELSVRNQKIANIHDLISFQISLKDLSACYLTLMHIHDKYKESGHFKNYISTPKPNGYRSIHTTVNGFKDHLVQFQICTREMDQMNNYGLATFFDQYPKLTGEEIIKQFASCDRFSSTLNSINDYYSKNDEFMAQMYSEVLTEQIIVYSRDGDTYYLPKGATVLDFAYQIHSEVGSSAIAGVINGEEYPLDYKLNDGDTIEIITDPNKSYQKEECLKFVLTTAAKVGIKRAQKAYTRERIKKETIPVSKI